MIYKYFLLSAEALNVLPRTHPSPLSGRICRAGDRCRERASGMMAPPHLRSLIRRMSPTAILSSGCLAAELILQDEDGCVVEEGGGAGAGGRAGEGSSQAARELGREQGEESRPQGRDGRVQPGLVRDKSQHVQW